MIIIHATNLRTL